MSTQCSIRFCDGNKEVGVIVLWADGYPSFVRDQVLIDLADRVKGQHEGEAMNAAEAMKEFPKVLASLYAIDLDVSDDMKALNGLYKTFPASQSEGDRRFDRRAYQYTVHIVNGEMYF